MLAALLPALEVWIALGLLGLALVALPRAWMRAWATFRGTPELRWLAVAVALAAAARWVIAPLQIVTMFIGYRLTEQAIDLVPSSHYGVGSQALYHALF